MDKTVETLKHYYGAFIDQTNILAFFTGLADYMNYVMETPALKKIVDAVMRRKEDLNIELERLEAERLAELQPIKKKLLKIIEEKKIDPNSLSSYTSMPPFPEEKENLLTRLEAFESGRITSSGFKSDNIERYLFDMAANLLKLGYKDSIKEYLVSGKEYGNRHSDPDSELEVTGNIHGNFVFF
jgi:hypothetical protein